MQTTPRPVADPRPTATPLPGEGSDDTATLGRPFAERTALERALAEPSAFERLRSSRPLDPSASFVRDAERDGGDASGPTSLAETPEGTLRRAEALELVPSRTLPPRDEVIEIVITPPTKPTRNTVVGGHNEDEHHDEGGNGGGLLILSSPVQGAPMPQRQVTTATVTIDSPGTTRPTVPSLAASRIPPTTLLLERAPEWVRRLPPHIAVPFALALYPRPAGDTRVYGFPIAEDVRVTLDGTTGEPGRVSIDGVDTGILVHPVRDAAGEIEGFAPDDYFDQHELQRLTGAWVALSENGTAQDTPIVGVAGGGSVRGPGKKLTGSPREKRNTISENVSGLLIATKENRHLQRIPDPRGSQSAPDYIDIDTGERIDIYSPEGSLSTIRREVKDKMKKDQADIVVVNINNSPQPLREIYEELEEMPRDRLVTIIDKGGFFHYLEPNVDDLSSSSEQRSSVALG